MNKPNLPHLKSSKDLETTYEAVRAGFVALALEKNRQATPYVEEARALKVAASTAKTPSDLLNIPDIQSALLTAAGVSDKANNHLMPRDKKEAIKGLIDNFLEPAGKKFVEELVFRFLLIRGDSLGGSMRNIGGVLAQRKLIRSIISALKVAGKSYEWLHSETNVWGKMSENDAEIEIFIRGISWKKDTQCRTALFNLIVPIVGNNIDLCLFNRESKDFSNKKIARDILNSSDSYIALGELKGGIDPAGADEHWKTARTALSRIQDAFSKFGHKPYLFFIGAAIESKMATEIWNMLKTGKLSNAANLTDDNQIASVSRWLCNL
ncbi:MAG: restriction endonuclease [Planctomycetes bacterium]|nr:restriction endonuclease [Planctomycetota bacterium]MBM4066883.1 restriction endonuclease [Planctomycetota bacterium]